MLVVPLLAIPAQTLTISLNFQACVIDVYQKRTGVYCDLYVNDTLIIGGVLCHDYCKIVRDVYLGFLGDLAFIDTQGIDDPYYTGFGSRWYLVYYTPEELEAFAA